MKTRFEVNDQVKKVGGSYWAVGTIKAVFAADDGSARYVFRFNSPPGLLHIFGDGNLEPIEPPRIRDDAPVEMIREEIIGDLKLDLAKESLDDDNFNNA